MKSSSIFSVDASSLDVDTFKEKYLSQGIPIVIRGAYLEHSASKWTFDTLTTKGGETIAQVRKNVSKESYKVGLKYSIEEMTVKKYLDMLLNEPQKAKNYYMAVQNIRGFTEISHEATLPKYIEKKHMGPYLWVGSQDHYEFCHFDPDDGCLMMIQGQKQVKLFKGLKPMYPNKLGSLGRTIQSQVDCNAFDLEKFPNLKDTVCEEAILEPGDCLFIPAFYWHQVTALSPSISIKYHHIYS